MAVKMEDGFIRADTEQELRQGLQEQWSEICKCSSRKAAERVIQVQKWQTRIENVNQALLALAAALVIAFPFGCLMMMRLVMMANAYVSMTGI